MSPIDAAVKQHNRNQKAVNDGDCQLSKECLIMINFITEILSPDDRCVCVFTEQEGFQKNLVVDEDGSFKSGIWKLDELDMLGVSKVVVYYRNDRINKIITGNYRGISPTIFRGHYCIHFQVTHIDQTLTNWNDFCNSRRDSVKYYRQD